MNELCETCKYRVKLYVPGERESRTVACYYIAVTGHRRGCDSENCMKYEKGNPKKPKGIQF